MTLVNDEPTQISENPTPTPLPAPRPQGLAIALNVITSTGMGQDAPPVIHGTGTAPVHGPSSASVGDTSMEGAGEPGGSSNPNSVTQQRFDAIEQEILRLHSQTHAKFEELLTKLAIQENEIQTKLNNSIGELVKTNSNVENIKNKYNEFKPSVEAEFIKVRGEIENQIMGLKVAISNEMASKIEGIKAEIVAKISEEIATKIVAVQSELSEKINSVTDTLARTTTEFSNRNTEVSKKIDHSVTHLAHVVNGKCGQVELTKLASSIPVVENNVSKVQALVQQFETRVAQIEGRNASQDGRSPISGLSAILKTPCQDLVRIEDENKKKEAEEKVDARFKKLEELMKQKETEIGNLKIQIATSNRNQENSQRLLDSHSTATSMGNHEPYVIEKQAPRELKEVELNRNIYVNNAVECFGGGDEGMWTNYDKLESEKAKGLIEILYPTPDGNMEYEKGTSAFAMPAIMGITETTRETNRIEMSIEAVYTGEDDNGSQVLFISLRDELANFAIEAFNSDNADGVYRQARKEIAKHLSIPVKQVLKLKVYEGSIILQFEINIDPPIENNNSSNDSNNEILKTIAKLAVPSEGSAYSKEKHSNIEMSANQEAGFKGKLQAQEEVSSLRRVLHSTGNASLVYEILRRENKKYLTNTPLAKFKHVEGKINVLQTIWTAAKKEEKIPQYPTDYKKFIVIPETRSPDEKLIFNYSMILEEFISSLESAMGISFSSTITAELAKKKVLNNFLERKNNPSAIYDWCANIKEGIEHYNILRQVRGDEAIDVAKSTISTSTEVSEFAKHIDSQLSEDYKKSMKEQLRSRDISHGQRTLQDIFNYITNRSRDEIEDLLNTGGINSEDIETVDNSNPNKPRKKKPGNNTSADDEIKLTEPIVKKINAGQTLSKNDKFATIKTILPHVTDADLTGFIASNAKPSDSWGDPNRQKKPGKGKGGHDDATKAASRGFHCNGNGCNHWRSHHQEWFDELTPDERKNRIEDCPKCNGRHQIKDKTTGKDLGCPGNNAKRSGWVCPPGKDKFSCSYGKESKNGGKNNKGNDTKGGKGKDGKGGNSNYKGGTSSYWGNGNYGGNNWNNNKSWNDWGNGNAPNNPNSQKTATVAPDVTWEEEPIFGADGKKVAGVKRAIPKTEMESVPEMYGLKFYIGNTNYAGWMEIDMGNTMANIMDPEEFANLSKTHSEYLQVVGPVKEKAAQFLDDPEDAIEFSVAVYIPITIYDKQDPKKFINTRQLWLVAKQPCATKWTASCQEGIRLGVCPKDVCLKGNIRPKMARLPNTTHLNNYKRAAVKKCRRVNTVAIGAQLESTIPDPKGVIEPSESGLVEVVLPKSASLGTGFIILEPSADANEKGVYFTPLVLKQTPTTRTISVAIEIHNETLDCITANLDIEDVLIKTASGPPSCRLERDKIQRELIEEIAEEKPIEINNDKIDYSEYETPNEFNSNSNNSKINEQTNATAVKRGNETEYSVRKAKITPQALRNNKFEVFSKNVSVIKSRQEFKEFIDSNNNNENPEIIVAPNLEEIDLRKVEPPDPGSGKSESTENTKITTDNMNETKSDNPDDDILIMRTPNVYENWSSRKSEQVKDEVVIRIKAKPPETHSKLNIENKNSENTKIVNFKVDGEHPMSPDTDNNSKSHIKVSKHEKKQANAQRKTAGAIEKLKIRLEELRKIDEQEVDKRDVSTVISEHYKTEISLRATHETVERLIRSAQHRQKGFYLQGKTQYPTITGYEARWSLIPGLSGGSGRVITHGLYSSLCMKYHVATHLRNGFDVEYTWEIIKRAGLPLLLSPAFLVPRGIRTELRIAIDYSRPHNTSTTSPVFPTQILQLNQSKIGSFVTAGDCALGYMEMCASEQVGRLTAWTTGVAECPCMMPLTLKLGPKQSPSCFISATSSIFGALLNAKAIPYTKTYMDDVSTSGEDQYPENVDGSPSIPILFSERPEFRLSPAENPPDTEAEMQKIKGIPTNRWNHSMFRERQLQSIMNRAQYRSRTDCFDENSGLYYTQIPEPDNTSIVPKNVIIDQRNNENNYDKGKTTKTHANARRDKSEILYEEPPRDSINTEPVEDTLSKPETELTPCVPNSINNRQDKQVVTITQQYQDVFASILRKDLFKTCWPRLKSVTTYDRDTNEILAQYIVIQNRNINKNTPNNNNSNSQFPSTVDGNYNNNNYDKTPNNTINNAAPGPYEPHRTNITNNPETNNAQECQTQGKPNEPKIFNAQECQTQGKPNELKISETNSITETKQKENNTTETEKPIRVFNGEQLTDEECEQGIVPISGPDFKPRSITVEWQFVGPLPEEILKENNKKFIENELVDNDGRMVTAAIFGGLAFSLVKHQICKDQIESLGRIVSAGGEALGDKAWKKLKGMKLPQEKSELEALINMVSWEGIRQYIHGLIEYSKILRPYILPRKNAKHRSWIGFKDDKKAHAAWEMLHSQVERALIIYPPDYDNIHYFIECCDTSKWSLCAGLFGVYQAHQDKTDAKRNSRIEYEKKNNIEINNRELPQDQVFIPPEEVTDVESSDSDEENSSSTKYEEKKSKRSVNNKTLKRRVTYRCHGVLRQGFQLESTWAAKSRELRGTRKGLEKFEKITKGFQSIVLYDHLSNNPDALESSESAETLDGKTTRDIERIKKFLWTKWWAHVGGKVLRFSDGGSRLYSTSEVEYLEGIPDRAKSNARYLLYWLLNPSSRNEDIYNKIRKEYYEDQENEEKDEETINKRCQKVKTAKRENIVKTLNPRKDEKYVKALKSAESNKKVEEKLIKEAEIVTKIQGKKTKAELEELKKRISLDKAIKIEGEEITPLILYEKADTNTVTGHKFYNVVLKCKIHNEYGRNTTAEKWFSVSKYKTRPAAMLAACNPLEELLERKGPTVNKIGENHGEFLIIEPKNGLKTVQLQTGQNFELSTNPVCTNHTVIRQALGFTRCKCKGHSITQEKQIKEQQKIFKKRPGVSEGKRNFLETWLTASKSLIQFVKEQKIEIDQETKDEIIEENKEIKTRSERRNSRRTK